jgi:hypothetical protein
MATLRGFERDDFIWIALSHLRENKTQKECKKQLRRARASITVSGCFGLRWFRLNKEPKTKGE